MIGGYWTMPLFAGLGFSAGISHRRAARWVTLALWAPPALAWLACAATGAGRLLGTGNWIVTHSAMASQFFLAATASATFIVGHAVGEAWRLRRLLSLAKVGGAVVFSFLTTTAPVFMVVLSQPRGASAYHVTSIRIWHVIAGLIAGIWVAMNLRAALRRLKGVGVFAPPGSPSHADAGEKSADVLESLQVNEFGPDEAPPSGAPENRG